MPQPAGRPDKGPAISIERVSLSEVRDLVRLHEPLPFRVLDAQGRLLLAQGQVLLGEDQLTMLVERGAWVEQQNVATARQARDAAGTGSGVPSARRLTLFDTWEHRVWELDALLRRLLKRHDGLAGEIEAFCEQQVALIDRDPDIALFLAVRQDEHRFALYALTHALHTATVAVLAARQLGWDAPRVSCIARAALTMNVAILELQARMAEQDTPPTNKQMEQIRAHPLLAVKLLREGGVADAAWLDTVLNHHEHADGRGYPRGLTQVSELAALLRAADVFMAKISPRALRAALLPQVAARQLFQQEAGGPVAAALIKALGVYPPGDLVLLRSGEAAIVTHRGSAGPAPKVAVLSDRQGRPVHTTTPRDSADAEFAITGPLLERAAFGRVLAERVYGLIEA